MYVPTAALVTDLAVHFKQGDENSLVWVTTLETRDRSPDAAVAIADCNGNGCGTAPPIAGPRAGAEDRRRQQSASSAKTWRPTKYDFYTSQTQALQELGAGAACDGASRRRLQLRPFELAHGIESWRFHLPQDDGVDRPCRAYRARSAAVSRGRNRPHETFPARQDRRRGLRWSRPPSVRRT